MSHTSGVVFGVVLLLFIVSILGAASSIADTNDRTPRARSDESNPRVDTEEVNAMVGDELTVLLEGARGYMWEIVTTGTSPSSSLQTGAISPRGNPLIGRKVVYGLSVVPKVSGILTLELRYFRAADPTYNPILKTVIFNVEAQSTDAADVLHLETGTATHTISGTVGRKIHLSLDGNPSTGYMWEIVPRETSSSLTTSDITQQPRSTGRGDLVGGNEKYLLNVVPMATGPQILKLQYHRASQPTNTFKTVTINVAA